MTTPAPRPLGDVAARFKIQCERMKLDSLIGSARVRCDASVIEHQWQLVALQARCPHPLVLRQVCEDCGREFKA